MLSKNIIKLVRSLEQKKHRLEQGLFVAEGSKVVGDLLRHGYKPAYIFATDEWKPSLTSPITPHSIPDRWSPTHSLSLITPSELQRISFLQHPQQVLAVFALPTPPPYVSQGITLALDGIQDPGNLGTIIRLADWFGIANIVCSPDTADAWNPKVVQATMGSIARVNIYYTNLPSFLAQSSLPVCGTVLDGDNIYTAQLPTEAILVMGNEGNGISQQVRSMLTHRLLIPPAPRANTSDSPESLNVAIATAIACSEFARRLNH